MKSTALGLALVLGLAAAQARAESGLEEAAPPDQTEVSPGEPLPLDEALRLAAARPQLTAAALASLDRAEAALKTSWAALVPAASASLSYIHWDQANTATVGGQTLETQKQDDLKANLLLSVPLVSARTWLGVHAARAGVQVAELNLEVVRQALLLGVARAHYQALGLLTLVEVQRSQIRAAERHLAIATARHRSGTGPRLDVLRARTELLQARESLETSLLGLDNARDALASLTGFPGLPMPVATVELAEPPADGPELLDLGLRQREELRLARAAREQAGRAMTASWMQFIPSLNAAWQLNWQITEPAGFGSQDPTRWFLGLTLSIPLFDEGRYAELDLKRAEVTLAERQLQDAERQASLAIRQALRERHKALVLLGASDERARLAAETLTLAEEAYRNGTGASLEVTDARRTSQAAEVDRIAKRVSAQLALLELWRAVGQDLLRLPGGLSAEAHRAPSAPPSPVPPG
jgi:outer membrane protein TolC